MRNAVLVFFLIFLTGCASIQPPIKGEQSSEFKKQKTAVAFFDPINSIKYTEDVYLVLAVAQVSSVSDYSGIWDGDSALTKVHADELSKIGVNSFPILEHGASGFSKNVLASQKASVKDFYEAKAKPENGPVLLPAFKDALRSNGYANLILISWSGYLLHIPTLGLPPREWTNNSFWVYDLSNEKPIWSGGFSATDKVILPKNTGKSFLEENDLAGLKAQSEKLARLRYRTKSSEGAVVLSIGQAIGFQAKD